MRQSRKRLIPETKPRKRALPVPRLVRWLPALAALLLAGGIARPAHGQVWVDASQLDGRLPDWVDPAYVNPTPRQEPAVALRRWCEPVYRIITRRIWHGPVVREVTERVWVAPRYEWRDCWCDGSLSRELVLFEPGHYTTCQREIVVTPGFWETVELREVVSEGHFED